MKIKTSPKPPPPPTAEAHIQTKVNAPSTMEHPVETEELWPTTVPTSTGEPVVTLKLGVTLGLPNYCSVRVDVGLAMPFDHGADAADAYTSVKEWVVSRLQAEVDELVEGLQS